MEGWIKHDRKSYMRRKSMYKRKTKDIWQLITDYGNGSEVECEYENEEEALEDYKTYKEERKEGFIPTLKSIKLKKRRVKNDV
jgi:hypothetical protein